MVFPSLLLSPSAHPLTLLGGPRESSLPRKQGSSSTLLETPRVPSETTSLLLPAVLESRPGPRWHHPTSVTRVSKRPPNSGPRRRKAYSVRRTKTFKENKRMKGHKRLPRKEPHGGSGRGGEASRVRGPAPPVGLRFFGAPAETHRDSRPRRRGGWTGVRRGRVQETAAAHPPFNRRILPRRPDPRGPSTRAVGRRDARGLLNALPTRPLRGPRRHPLPSEARRRTPGSAVDATTQCEAFYLLRLKGGGRRRRNPPPPSPPPPSSTSFPRPASRRDVRVPAPEGRPVTGRTGSGSPHSRPPRRASSRAEKQSLPSQLTRRVVLVRCGPRGRRDGVEPLGSWRSRKSSSRPSPRFRVTGAHTGPTGVRGLRHPCNCVSGVGRCRRTGGIGILGGRTTGVSGPVVTPLPR